MNGFKVLVADDDESIALVLDEFFADKGVECVKALDGVEAARLIRDPGVRLALLDINMPGKHGLEILKEVKEGKDGADSPAVIIMTAESTMENTLEAMKRGAFDYLTKPFDLEELDIVVERAIENVRLKEKLSTVTERLRERLESETVFVGKSRAVRNVFKTVGKVAPRDVTVLLLGESGTGKELLARLIHANSPRSDGPFIAVNSAAVPSELMESELLGFEKGAFTGAVEAKAGKFELADGGTLFLDEVGDMSPDLQAKLLRVIQEREFFKVGGREPVRVDVRIIAATNQDLEKMVAERRFREDLYFRLGGVAIKLPPLRERRGDIPVLAGHFIEKFSDEFDSGPKRLSDKALAGLEGYEWPGNVRELENVLRRAVLLSPGVVITPDDLALPQRGGKRESLEDIITARLKPVIDRTGQTGKHDLYAFIMPFMERPLVRLVLEKTGGNQVKAAELLGINRNTLRKKIKELGIDVGRR